MRAPAERSTLGIVRTGIGVALVASLAIGSSLAALIARANHWPIGLDLLLLAGHLTLIYGALVLVGLAAGAAFLMLLGRRPGVREFAGMAAAGVVLLNGLTRFISSVQLLSVTPHMSAIGALDLLTVSVAAAAVGLGVAAGGARRQFQGLGVAVGLLLALDLLHRWHERPLERDLAQAVPAALASAPVARPAPASEPFANARLLVLGFDGLSWEVLLPLLRRGELPNFRAVLSDAAYGYLATLPVAVSPVIWETIATGQPPERHGIGYHVHFRLPGLTRKICFLPSYRLAHTPMRVRALLSLISRLGLVEQIPADASDARVARFWEVASRAQISVGLYDWLNLAPVSELRGFLHGQGGIQPNDFPPDLEQGLATFPPYGNEVVPGVAWVRSKGDLERIAYRRFTQLAQRYGPQVLAYYTHFPDAVNHLNWKQETWGDGLFFAGLSHPEIDPGEPTTAVMRVLDDFVGDVLARLPPDALLAIVSDHGFDFRGYEHDNSPPGVVILRGSGVRPGLVQGATVYDVAPTLLHSLGLAVADDMDGSPLPVAATGGPLDRAPSRVPSYGSAASPVAPGATRDAELRKYQEYLRALGYVN
jgi:hypothetical protein